MRVFPDGLSLYSEVTSSQVTMTLSKSYVMLFTALVLSCQFNYVYTGLLRSIFRPTNARVDTPGQEKFIILAPPVNSMPQASLSTCDARQLTQTAPAESSHSSTFTLPTSSSTGLTYLPASALHYPQVLNTPISTSFTPAMSPLPFSTVLANPSTLSQVFSTAPFFSSL